MALAAQFEELDILATPEETQVLQEARLVYVVCQLPRARRAGMRRRRCERNGRSGRHRRWAESCTNGRTAARLGAITETADHDPGDCRR